MRPHALRNAVVVGHDFRFQRMSGNLVERRVLAARTQLVEIVITLTDHRFPDENLRGNQVAEIIRTGVVGTPARGNISCIAVLHDSADEQFYCVGRDSIVVIVRVIIPEILVLFRE